MSEPAPSIKVYSGLSLRAADVKRALPGAAFAGPVSRGDVPRDVARGVGVVVIVDGRFLQSLAVSPGELMDALRCGTRLYGCSSMGALRAVELEAHGMIGHGEIFEHIRQNPFFGDDLLGLTFREDTLETLTVPYIDLHFALRDLTRRGRATRGQATRILQAFAALPFPERDPARVEARLTEAHGASAAPLRRLARLALRSARQKRLDALATLARVKADLRAVATANRRLDTTRRPRRFLTAHGR